MTETLRRLARCAVVMLMLNSAGAGEPAETISLTPEEQARCLEVLRNGLRSSEFWPSMHAAEALTQSGHGKEVTELLPVRLQTTADDQQRCGLARELVSRVQRMRKETGLAVSDRIRLWVEGDEAVRVAAESHREWIAEEVLARALVVGAGPADERDHATREVDLDGLRLRVALTRDS